MPAVTRGSSLPRRRGAAIGLLFVAVVAVLSALIAGRGLWLLMLGGPLHSVLLGIGYVISGVLLLYAVDPRKEVSTDE